MLQVDGPSVVCRPRISSAASFGAFSKLVTPALFGMGQSRALIGGRMNFPKC